MGNILYLKLNINRILLFWNGILILEGTYKDGLLNGMIINNLNMKDILKMKVIMGKEKNIIRKEK